MTENKGARRLSKSATGMAINRTLTRHEFTADSDRSAPRAEAGDRRQRGPFPCRDLRAFFNRPNELALFLRSAGAAGRRLIRLPFSTLFPRSETVLETLTKSMRETGFNLGHPIHVWTDAPDGYVVLDGHHRLEAALAAGLEEVPVHRLYFASEKDALEYAIAQQRDRRNMNPEELRAHVARAIAALDATREERVGNRAKNAAKNETSREVSNTAKETADLVGVSRATVERVRTVLDNGSEDTKAALASGAVSVNGAYRKVQEERKRTEPVNTPAPTFTPAEWQAAPVAQKEKAADAVADSETKFNRTNANVEWALWTWNPITGCLHDCDYCYARDIAERFYPQKFAPTLHPARFGASARTPRPSDEKVAAAYDEARVAGGLGEKNVFTCSMADLFGKWVPDDWIEKVLAEVRGAPQWNFLLLTKFPQRLAGYDFPDNAWVGTTVDTQARVKTAEAAFADVKARVKWLSCEPMLERLTFSRLDLFDWLVIGGASRSTQTPEFRPPFEWAADLVLQARQAKTAVYMKTNLLDRVREYPEASSGQAPAEDPDEEDAARRLQNPPRGVE